MSQDSLHLLSLSPKKRWMKSNICYKFHLYQFSLPGSNSGSFISTSLVNKTLLSLRQWYQNETLKNQIADKLEKCNTHNETWHSIKEIRWSEREKNNTHNDTCKSLRQCYQNETLKNRISDELDKCNTYCETWHSIKEIRWSCLLFRYSMVTYMVIISVSAGI